jgi:hypothetical protein
MRNLQKASIDVVGSTWFNVYILVAIPQPMLGTIAIEDAKKSV